MILHQHRRPLFLSQVPYWEKSEQEAPIVIVQFEKRSIVKQICSICFSSFIHAFVSLSFLVQQKEKRVKYKGIKVRSRILIMAQKMRELLSKQTTSICFTA